ncbi:Sex peptide receptor, partial [Pseudolycoriella hygida]
YFNGNSFHFINSEENISQRYNEYSMNRTSELTMIYDDSNYEEKYCMNMVNNTTYLNVSCETNLSYSVPLYGYFAPFLLFTTVTANTLIVLVLSKRNMATPTNAVLMAMALCDMFTLVFPAPGLWYMYTFGNHYKPLAPISACYAWNVFNENEESSSGSFSYIAKA